MNRCAHEIIRCRYCGETLLADRVTCPNCGKIPQLPFYRQGEFWGLLVALMAVGIAVASTVLGMT